MADRPPNRIAELREHYSYSVRDLAQKLGWDHNKLHRLELGTTRLDVPTMRTIASALGLKASALLNSDDVELRSDRFGREIAEILDSVPEEHWRDFLTIAQSLQKLAHALAAKGSGATLAGEAGQIGELREVWNSFDETDRTYALNLLKRVRR